MREFIKRYKKECIIISIALTILDAAMWFSILGARSGFALYFLSVGQGDSALISFDQKIDMMIDGGPAGYRTLEEIGNRIPPTDRYLDMLIISHPQLDHFGGFIEILKRYKVGMIVHNGREGTSKAYKTLQETIRERGVKTVTVAAGDTIRYKKYAVKVLWPPRGFKPKNVNDSSLVIEMVMSNTTALFTGDIGMTTENQIIKNYTTPIDILKVPHHGSRFSSSNAFLASLAPRIAVIDVGKNKYGHPTEEVLNRLQQSGSRIFRTDHDGTLEITENKGAIIVRSLK